MLLPNNPEMKVKKFVTIVIVFFLILLMYSIWDDHLNIRDGVMSNRELQYEFSKLAALCNKKQDLLANDSKSNPTIYCITPTYARPVQEAELTRLAQTLCLVPNIHWIIIEDATERTDFMIKFLAETPCLLPYTHLYSLTPSNYKITKGLKWDQRPRGVSQRNEALNWLRENLNPASDNGLVFFMDDDNTYSVRLFKEISKVKKVGVWPVGLVGGLNVEKPLVDPTTGKVSGFNAVWEPTRPFPIDMAGFAISLKLILEKPEALFSYTAKPGYQETEILQYFTTVEDLEPLSDNCTKVYVWHTRTEKPKFTKQVQKRLQKRESRAVVDI